MKKFLLGAFFSILVAGISLADFSSEVQFRNAWFNSQIKVGGSTAKSDDDALILKNGSTIVRLYTIENFGSTLHVPSANDHLVARETQDTLKNKTIDADNNILSNIDNGEIKPSAGILLSKLEIVTSDRVIVSDSGGILSAGSITTTELGHLSGLTFDVQSHIHDGSSGTKILGTNIDSGITANGSVLAADGAGGTKWAAPGAGGGGATTDTHVFKLLGFIGTTYEHVDGYYYATQNFSITQAAIALRLSGSGSTAVRVNCTGPSGFSTQTVSVTGNDGRATTLANLASPISVQNGDVCDMDVPAVGTGEVRDLSVKLILE